MRVIEYMTSSVWAITPDALDLMFSIASEREVDIATLETRLGKKLNHERNVAYHEASDGKRVAVIPIEGPIFPKANMMTEHSGATSARSIALDLQAAVLDPNVKSIMLNIDSPGGAVTGISELSSMIRAASDIKPVVSYADGRMCSAAYWLGSAANSVYSSETAEVGSIGVIARGIDDSEHMKAKGMKEFEIKSQNAPKKNMDPTTPEGRAAYQDKINKMEAIMLRDISANRGIKPKDVVANYGQGDVMLGMDAVKSGMVDGITTMDNLLDAMLHADSSVKSFVAKHIDGAEGIADNVVDASNAEPNPARTVAQKTMKIPGYIANLLSGGELSAADRMDAARALMETATEGEPVVMQAATLGPIAISAEAQAEIDDLKAQLKAVNEKIAMDAHNARVSEAEAWAGDLVKANRILPAQAEELTSLYLALGSIEMDCGANEDGTPKRVSVISYLDNFIKSGPEHGWNKEAAQTAPTMRIVRNSDAPAEGAADMIGDTRVLSESEIADIVALAGGRKKAASN